MKSVENLTGAREGDFVDYSAVQKLAENDTFLNNKTTNITIQDPTYGYFNETSGKISIYYKRITGIVCVPNVANNPSQITFPSTFAFPPNVQVAVHGPGSEYVRATVSNNQSGFCQVRLWNRFTASRTIDVSIMAIGVLP